MAGKKIAELTGLGALGDADTFVVIDDSDKSESAQGTTKRILASAVLADLTTLLDDLGSNVEGSRQTLSERLDLMDAAIAAAGNDPTADLTQFSLPRCRVYRSTVQQVRNSSGTPDALVGWDTVRWQQPADTFWEPSSPSAINIPATANYSGTAYIQFAAGSATIGSGVRGAYVLVVPSGGGSNRTLARQAVYYTPNTHDGQNPTLLEVNFTEDLYAGDKIQVKIFQSEVNVNNVSAGSTTAQYLNDFYINTNSYVAGGPPTGGNTDGTYDPLPASIANWYPTASVFSTPIASLDTTGKAVQTGSSTLITNMLSRFQGNAIDPANAVVTFNEQVGRGGQIGDFSHPVYIGDTTDPLMTIVQGFNGQWVNPDIEGAQVHLPQGAIPAGGSDGSMGIVQNGGPLDGWEYDLWGVHTIDWTNHTIICGFGSRGLFSGKGLYSGGHGGITAAGYLMGIGVIKTEELTGEDGSGPGTPGTAGVIRHALFVAINGWHGRVYPSRLDGGTTGSTTANTPAMGAHIQLNPALDVSGFTPWKRAILTCMQDYGLYVGDAGGSTFNMHLESDTPYVGLQQFPTTLQHLGTWFNHTGVWDIDSGVDWPNQLRVLNPPQAI